jgi:hypothetical protein
MKLNGMKDLATSQIIQAQLSLSPTRKMTLSLVNNLWSQVQNEHGIT